MNAAAVAAAIRVSSTAIVACVINLVLPEIALQRLHTWFLNSVDFAPHITDLDSLPPRCPTLPCALLLKSQTLILRVMDYMVVPDATSSPWVALTYDDCLMFSVCMLWATL